MAEYLRAASLLVVDVWLDIKQGQDRIESFAQADLDHVGPLQLAPTRWNIYSGISTTGDIRSIGVRG